MNVDRPARSFRLPWQNRQAKLPADSETYVSRRVPLIGILPLAAKNHFIAMMAEFAGTFMFLLFAFGGTNVVNAAPADDQPAELSANPAKILFISLCFGMSLAVNAWVFFRISGGLFNPAVRLRSEVTESKLTRMQVSLGMMVVGGVPYIRGCLVIASQLLGGIAAAAVVSGLTPGPLNVRTSLSGGTSIVQGLFIEVCIRRDSLLQRFELTSYV